MLPVNERGERLSRKRACGLWSSVAGVSSGEDFLRVDPKTDARKVCENVRTLRPFLEEEEEDDEEEDEAERALDGRGSESTSSSARSTARLSGIFGRLRVDSEASALHERRDTVVVASSGDGGDSLLLALALRVWMAPRKRGATSSESFELPLVLPPALPLVARDMLGKADAGVARLSVVMTTLEGRRGRMASLSSCVLMMVSRLRRGR